MTARKGAAKKNLHFLIGLDYDGTLTPIVRDPARAVLIPQTREILRRLARRPDCTVAVISGRKLGELKRLVGLRGVIYVGNHGFELAGKGWKFLHPSVPRARPVLKRIGAVLRRRLESIPGAEVEDKGATLTVHFRRVKKPLVALTLKAIADTIPPYVIRRQVDITFGKKVVEVRPPEPWDKGAVLRWIRDQIRREKGVKVFPVFIGDDVTDESAFAAVAKIGLGVKVGKDARKTRARGRLAGIPQTRQLLRHLSQGKWETITRPGDLSGFTPVSTSRN